MRFIVYGAGAIGGVIGARLHESGADVTLIARGEHLARLRSEGLSIEDDQGTRTLPIPAVETPDAARIASGDVVILALKAQHTAGTLAALAAVAPEASVVCAQNGIDNERQAARLFADVYGAYVSCLASHLRPGAVIAHAGPVTGTIDVGRYPHGVDATAAAIVARLSAARFSSHARADVMAWKNEKLLVNLGTTVEAICGPQARQGRLAALARAEGEAVLAAAGAPRPAPAELKRSAEIASTVVIPRTGGSSWQSLRRGAGSIESDYINGEIVLLGRLHGVATPANQLIQRWAARLAARGAEPGSVSEDALLAELNS
jgi:2-dehydropantoate 2-reductase